MSLAFDEAGDAGELVHIRYLGRVLSFGCESAADRVYLATVRACNVRAELLRPCFRHRHGEGRVRDLVGDRVKVQVFELLGPVYHHRIVGAAKAARQSGNSAGIRSHLYVEVVRLDAPNDHQQRA